MIGKKIKYTSNLISISEDNLDQVGVKSFILHKIAKEHIPLTNNFVITTNAFDDFIVSNNLAEKVSDLIDEIDIEDQKRLKKISENIQKLILDAEFPSEVKSQIIQGYKNLSGLNKVFVELIPSPINLNISKNDLSDYKILNIHSEEKLLEGVKKTWANLFSVKSLNYREKNEYSGELSLALIIQKMPHPDSSGRAYNYDTTDNNPAILEIEAKYGIMSYPESDSNLGDQYKVIEKNLDITEKTIVVQEKMIVRSRNESENFQKEVDVSKPWKKKQKIDDRNIIEIGEILLKIQNLLGDEPFYFDWAKEADKTYILDINFPKNLEFTEEYSFPEFHTPKVEIIPASKMEENKTEEKKISEIISETNDKRMDYIVNHKDIKKEEKTDKTGKIILSGIGNKLDITKGKVKLINELSDLNYLNPDHILIISENINASLLNLNILSVAGIIYEGKVDTNLPTINDAYRAESILHEGETITIDPNTGAVYLGDVLEKISSETEVKSKPKQTKREKPESNEKPEEKIIAIPEEDYVKTAIDTFVQINSKASFPEDTRNINGFFSNNSRNIKDLSEQFGERPIILESNYSELSEYKKDIVKIAKLRNKYNHRNLWVSIDGINRSEELIDAKKIITSEKIRRSSTFNILVSVSDPTSILGLVEIVEVDIDGIVLRCNELILKLFGKEKEEFYEETAFMTSVDKVFNIAKKYKKKVWVSGKMPENTIKKLISLGANSFITAPDNIRTTRLIVANSEIESLTKKPRKQKLR